MKNLSQIRQEIINNIAYRKAVLEYKDRALIFRTSIVIGIFLIPVGLVYPLEFCIKNSCCNILPLLGGLIVMLMVFYSLHYSKKRIKFLEDYKSSPNEEEVNKEYLDQVNKLRAETINKIMETKKELDSYGEDLKLYQDIIERSN
jgi:hypothetical protein